tara:strand:- start:161 stop:409 length:249 start_codon:yes stop_codon:yes gene_type:complete
VTIDPKRLAVRAVLSKQAALRIGTEHATQDAKDKYMDEHKGADPANHSVKKVVEKYKETKEKGKKLVDDVFEFADQEKHVQK